MNPSEHEAIRRRLPELAEGEILRDERARIESHLAVCKVCRDELSSLVETLGMLRALPHPKAPPDLAAKIKSRIRRRSALSRGREAVEHKIETTSAAAVMVATLIVIGTRLVVPSPEQLETPGTEAALLVDPGTTEPTSLFEIRGVDSGDALGILSRAASAGATDRAGDPIVFPPAGEPPAPGIYEVWVAQQSLRAVLTSTEPPEDSSGDEGDGDAADPADVDAGPRILLRMSVR